MNTPRRFLAHRSMLPAVIVAAVAVCGTPTVARADAGPADGPRVEFNRDVRPILSENCFYCHGQDPAHREADLRLDLRDEATRDLGGYAAIVPGKPDESEVVKLLTSTKPRKQMPPPASHRTVTPAQVELIKRWIAQGAAYQKHWAFEPPRRPAAPAVKRGDWPRGDVDRFVLARLEAEGLSPAPEAPPEKWLRRASLDLVGLPPTAGELDDFLADVKARGEPAYAAAADRLLASPRFGERQAVEWLDAARYADTHGFNNDSTRSMWRWRDWVIDAFNANMPYDQFLTEQLAGDLLPGATTDQRLATGFGRNHVINSEGGIIDEEYRVEYVADRVRTTSMAWLGLTFECARCHDHKFDPVTQKDYYRFFAFFNNVAEHGEDGRVANAVPLMPAPTGPQAERLAEQARELAALDAQLRPAREAFRWRVAEHAEAVRSAAAGLAVLPGASFTLDAEAAEPKAKAWSFPKSPPALADGVRGKAWLLDGTGPAAKLEAAAFAPSAKSGAAVAFWLRTDSKTPADVPVVSSLNYLGSPADAQYGKGYELRLVNGELEFRASNRFPVYAARVRTEGAAIAMGQWRHVAVSVGPAPDPEVDRVPASLVRLFVDGRELPTRVLNDGLATFPSAQPWLLGADNAKGGAAFRGAVDEWRAFPRPLAPAEVRALFAADAVPYGLARSAAGSTSPTEDDRLRDAALAVTDPAWRELADRRDRAWDEHLWLRREVPTAMVMAELSPPRPAHVLLRGAYDAPGDRVEPGVPEDLLAPWPDGAPRNRLGLARWLTRPDHPLVARVVVNRWWAQLFGTGLVKTLEDFGFQGEWPSHPELLDHLARAFVDGSTSSPQAGAGQGWDVKATLRTLVLSATYRQDSAVSPALLERDPENRLLARGPRVRLPAEVLRDQALAAGGLLRHRLGGPSVFPYQPADLYKGVVVGAKYPGTRWVQSTGDDLYRRSLYTFWKRTVPHPAMLTFDAPDREFCAVRRSRTNTPLQALALMNEPAFVEAARALGGRMLREGGSDDASRVAFGFRLATGRRPAEAEARVLTETWGRFRKEFAHDGRAAEALLTVGASKPDAGQPAPELAAAAVVANLILNLDETITKD